jgi:type II secretory pathway pseudopilin PulG
MTEPMPRGFTLIETLLYIALFALVMGGFMVATYQVIASTTRTQEKVQVQEEGDFLLHKIDWALTGASVIELPAVGATGDVLKVQNGGVTLEFGLASGHLQLKRDSGAFANLNSDNVTVTDLNFSHSDIDGVGGKPGNVAAGFRVEGQYFETLKYLRQ